MAQCLPDCTLQILCPALQPLEGATISYSNGLVYPTEATYTCDSGGGPPTEGDATLSCQEDGSWAGDVPTACGPSCSPLITNFLVYRDVQYATIENNPVDSNSNGCQDDRYVAMPDGYQVAIGTEDVIRNVIATHEWDCDCPIVADGESYSAPGGGACGSDELRTRDENGVTTYGIRPGCSRRVLIQCP